MDESTPERRAPKSAKTDAQQNFERNLRWAKERLGLTYPTLAKHADVDEGWLRRAATQGLRWTKGTGKKAVKNLEAYLGCPTNTLWESEGHSFRSGVTNKHLHGRDPVSAFEQVVRHFEVSPPPLLSKVIEMIEYLRRSIDDPTLEPPNENKEQEKNEQEKNQQEKNQQEKNQQILEQSKGGMVTWDRSSGWRFSEAGIEYILGKLNSQISYMIKSGVPGVSEIQIGQEDIERYVASIDPSDLGYDTWTDAYAAKYGITSEEVVRLVQQKQAEYEAKRAEEAARIEQERQAARQTAKKHAPTLIESLSDDESDCFLGIYQRPSQALKVVEQQLYERLMGELMQTKMTIEQAVENVRSQIIRDYRSEHEKEASRSRHAADSTEAQDSDDLYDVADQEKNDDFAHEQEQKYMKNLYGSREKSDLPSS